MVVLAMFEQLESRTFLSATAALPELLGPPPSGEPLAIGTKPPGNSFASTFGSSDRDFGAASRSFDDGVDGNVQWATSGWHEVDRVTFVPAGTQTWEVFGTEGSVTVFLDDDGDTSNGYSPQGTIAAGSSITVTATATGIYVLQENSGGLHPTAKGSAARL